MTDESRLADEPIDGPEGGEHTPQLEADPLEGAYGAAHRLPDVLTGRLFAARMRAASPDDP